MIGISKETVHELSELGADTGSRWFGSVKNRTKNCDGCQALRVIENQEWCLYGVGKMLFASEKPRVCLLIDPETGYFRENWPNWKPQEWKPRIYR